MAHKHYTIIYPIEHSIRIKLVFLRNTHNGKMDSTHCECVSTHQSSVIFTVTINQNVYCMQVVNSDARLDNTKSIETLH